MNRRQFLQNCGNRKCTYSVCFFCVQAMRVHYSRPLRCPQCRQEASYRIVLDEGNDAGNLAWDYAACGAAYWVWGYVLFQSFFPLYSSRVVHHVLFGVVGSAVLTLVICCGSFLVHFGEGVAELY